MRTPKLPSRQAAKPPKTAELNRTSDAVIAQNIADAPPAIAARYQAAYEQYGWSQFDTPSERKHCHE